ncbi:hypothetical protein TNCV_4604331 [Trichonephila clavipes]|nr:hypothetical protein TNCV_4604331 [Trichonephila clavipes]
MQETGTIGDRSRNFEPRSSNEDGTSLPHQANGRTWSLDRFNAYLPLLHGRSSMAPGLEPAACRTRVCNNSH